MNLITHPIPDYIESRITSRGGKAPNGLPLFRVIWGADRLTVIGGEWKSFDSNGNETGSAVEEKLTTKYCNAENRYVLEMWCPPENYGTRQAWKSDHTRMVNGVLINELGPYPENGEYELVMVIETPNKRAFVPLTATIVDAMVAVAIRNKHLPHAIRMEAFRDSQRRQEEQKDQRLVDRIAAMGSAFDGREYVTVPANLSKSGRIIQ